MPDGQAMWLNRSSRCIFARPMLTLSDSQMQAFAQTARTGFEAEMLAHLEAAAPGPFQPIGKAPVADAIPPGVDRARGYGLDRRGPVRLYLELMLLLGSGFATDPQYPWATEALGGGRDAPQMPRALRLYEAGQQYLKRAFGPEDACLHKAYGEIADYLRMPWDALVQDLAEDLRAQLKWVWPEKAACVGDSALRTLVQGSIADAQARGIGTPRGCGLMALLRFALGHHCCDDPLHPWIRASLAPRPNDDDRAAEGRLQDATRAWLEGAALGGPIRAAGMRQETSLTDPRKDRGEQRLDDPVVRCTGSPPRRQPEAEPVACRDLDELCTQVVGTGPCGCF